MENVYIWVSTGALFALAVIWKKSNWPNMFIKLALTGLAVWGLYCQLK